MKNKSKFSFLFLLPIAVTLATFAFGFASTKKNTISAWLVYWDTTHSFKNLKDNFMARIGEINPFVYVFDKDANIINACKNPTEYRQIIEVCNSGLGIKVIPTITNDVVSPDTENKSKDPAVIQHILNDRELRKKHIQQIRDIAKEDYIDGIDIDYENIDIADRNLFSQFISELSEELHRQNKMLNVTVQQKTEDHLRSGAGSIDWREISRYADKITIMCYGYSSKSSKPGPICPFYWLKKIIEFAVSQIPRDKICIALAFHGYDWSKETTNSLNFKIASQLIKKYAAKLRWDKKSRSPYFLYYDENKIKHQVWFENKKSILEKIKIIKKNKIQHIALWHLGILDPDLRQVIYL